MVRITMDVETYQRLVNLLGQEQVPNGMGIRISEGECTMTIPFQDEHLIMNALARSWREER